MSTSRRASRNSIIPRAKATILPRIKATAALPWAASCAAFCSRSIVAIWRKLPFSDDVNAQSRLLMRRNVRERAATLAPFLTFDPDPYIVVGDDGRLSLGHGRLHHLGPAIPIRTPLSLGR